MNLDYDWEPGEHDSRARRWVRRFAFVLGLVAFVWVVALVSGGDARSEEGDVPQTSSTYIPEKPFEPGEWNAETLYATYRTVDLMWQHADADKRSGICALLKTGYREKAARSLPEGDKPYEYSLEMDGAVDWYFAAQLLEVKCLSDI